MSWTPESAEGCTKAAAAPGLRRLEAGSEVKGSSMYMKFTESRITQDLCVMQRQLSKVNKVYLTTVSSKIISLFKEKELTQR